MVESAGHAQEWLSDGFGYTVSYRRKLVDVQTDYQHLEVLETPAFGKVLRLDGAFQCSERDEFFYHEPLVHVPAMLHPRPRSALVVGGGDGGAAEELLKHPQIEHVALAEIDPEVVSVSRRFLRTVNHGLFEPGHANGSRFAWRIGDGNRVMLEDAPRYDLILLDLTDPGGASSPLYEEPFYALCRARLEKGGILALHIAAPWAQQQRAAIILATLGRVFRHVTPYLATVPMSGGAWLMACCSDEPMQLDTARAWERCNALRGAPLQYYTPRVHEASTALPAYLLRALS